MNFLRRFAYALAGLVHCIKTEQNFRIHTAAGVTVLIFSAFYGLEAGQYPVLLLTIFLVLGLEAVNTAVERAVNLTADKPHPLAKAAKDCAAGAVLLGAVGSLAVAGFLFGDAGRLGTAFVRLFSLPWLPASLVYLGLCLVYIIRGGRKYPKNHPIQPKTNHRKESL